MREREGAGGVALQPSEPVGPLALSLSWCTEQSKLSPLCSIHPDTDTEPHT